MVKVFVGLKRLATKDSEGIKAGDIVEVTEFDNYGHEGEHDGFEAGTVTLKNLRTNKTSDHGACVLGPCFLDTVPVPAPAKPKFDYTPYLPNRVTPNTGPKHFQVGEVWVARLPGFGVIANDPVVYRVTADNGGEWDPKKDYVKIEVLAGRYGHPEIGRTSTFAEFSVRLAGTIFERDGIPRESPEEFFRRAFSEPKPFVPFAQFLPKIEYRVEKVAPKPPRWLKVVEQVMTKAKEHKKAGRVNFRQVLVPLEDYKALCEHFEVPTECGPEISTVIGPVSVWPSNPSGVTFVD